MACPPPLEFLLVDLPDLNMTGRVPQAPRHPIGFGGFAVVCKGNLIRLRAPTKASSEGGDEDTPLVVAIKSMKDFYKNNEEVEQVCLRVYICIARLHLLTTWANWDLAFLQRTIYMEPP